MQSFGRGLVLAGFVLTAWSCSTTIPPVDVNVPDLTFYYRIEGDGVDPVPDWIPVPVGVPISARPTETVHFWALAHDDEGVAEVAIQISGQRRCSTGSSGGSGSMTISTVHYEVVNGSDPGLGPGDSAPASQSALFQYNGASMGCPDEQQLRSATLAVQAHATNFSGGRETSTAAELVVD